MQSFKEFISQKEGFWGNVGRGVTALGHGALGAMVPAYGAYAAGRMAYQDYGDTNQKQNPNSQQVAQSAIKGLQQWQQSLSQDPNSAQLANYLNSVVAKLSQMAQQPAQQAIIKPKGYNPWG